MNKVTDISGVQFGRERWTTAQPVLVHFYTSWSGFRRILAPALKTLAGELADELNFRRSNMDKYFTEVQTLMQLDSGAPIAPQPAAPAGGSATGAAK